MNKTNFDFLKEIDSNLFNIVSDAERLYRGEFFEQCMGQTRRFGEHLCRNVLGSNRTTEVTFDEMIATLKDKTHGTEEEKEFIDDLYFLKKQGNASVHSGTVTKDAKTALECLQRAFEASLNYAVYNKKADKKLLNNHYDIELLATGKSSNSLCEKYQKVKENQVKDKKTTKPRKTAAKKQKPQATSMKSVPRKTGISPFWIAVGIFSVITLFTIIYILI